MPLFLNGYNEIAYAAHGYDRMYMFVWAIQVTGLNRAKIRDVLAVRRKPRPGVTGDILLDASMSDVGEIFLARREEGSWNYWETQKC